MTRWDVARGEARGDDRAHTPIIPPRPAQAKGRAQGGCLSAAGGVTGCGGGGAGSPATFASLEKNLPPSFTSGEAGDPSCEAGRMRHVSTRSDFPESPPLAGKLVPFGMGRWRGANFLLGVAGGKLR